MTQKKSRTTLLLAAAVVCCALPLTAESGEAASKGPKGVNIYLLANETTTTYDVVKTPLDDLVLRDEPWIASKNIVRYDTSTHCIHLEKPVEKAWKRIQLRGTPFVVTADGKRCYLGTLWTMSSSFLPPQEVEVPLIMNPLFAMSSRDLVHISGSAKVREDRRILEALKRDGKLSRGIRCTLDKVEVIRGESRTDIRYQYTVTNLDKEALYVLDTELMDYDDFRRYQNGIIRFDSLKKGGEGVGRPNPCRNLKESARPHGDIDPSWFQKLEPGKSFTRTATEPHFSEVLPGKYRCRLWYAYPGFSHGFTGKTTREERIHKDGRVWLGHLTATREVEVP